MLVNTMLRRRSMEDGGAGAAKRRETLNMGRFLAVWVLCLGVLSCTQKEKEVQPVVAVQVAPVRRTTIGRTITADAVLFPLNQAAITPKISAPVRRFYVNRGGRVRAGQLLAELENRDLAAAATENQGGYEQAQASYETTTQASVPEEVQKAELDAKAARESLDAQQKVYDSRKALFDQGALPRKDLDQAAVNLTQARNQYEMTQRHLQSLQSVSRQQELRAAAGQLEAAKGKYLGAKAQLSYSEIRSPIDGVVTDRPVYPGEMASVGTPLITVMDLSQVVARAHISQQEAALLKIGDPATLSLPASPGSASASPDTRASREEKADSVEDDVKGKVTLVSPALDVNSTTVEVWIRAPNRERRLKPGGSARVSILAETVPKALVVPAVSVLAASEGGGAYVMVVGADDRAHQRNVRTGIRQGDDVQILEGLEEAERVVTVGAYGLPDNTRVRIETPASKEDNTEPKQASEKDKD